MKFIALTSIPRLLVDNSIAVEVPDGILVHLVDHDTGQCALVFLPGKLRLPVGAAEVYLGFGDGHPVHGIRAAQAHLRYIGDADGGVIYHSERHGFAKGGRRYGAQGSAYLFAGEEEVPFLVSVHTVEAVGDSNRFGNRGEHADGRCHRDRVSTRLRECVSGLSALHILFLTAKIPGKLLVDLEVADEAYGLVHIQAAGYAEVGIFENRVFVSRSRVFAFVAAGIEAQQRCSKYQQEEGLFHIVYGSCKDKVKTKLLFQVAGYLVAGAGIINPLLNIEAIVYGFTTVFGLHPEVGHCAIACLHTVAGIAAICDRLGA